MAWLETHGEPNFIRESQSWRWVYQYSTYAKIKDGSWTIDISDPVDADEVARRYRERTRAQRYIGMTRATALELSDTLSGDESHRGVVARRMNEANAWEVYLEKVEADPDSMSDWVRASDFDPLTPPE